MARKNYKDEVTPQQQFKITDTGGTTIPGFEQVVFTRVDTPTQQGDPFAAADANQISDLTDPIVPDAVVSQEIQLTTYADNQRIPIEVQSLVSGGAITIARNGETAKPLYSDYALTEAVDELEPGVYTIIEYLSAFYLAPSFSDEWGGLEFIVDQPEGRLYLNDAGTDLIYEMDPIAKVPISSAAAPSATPRGTGGGFSRLYHCESSNNLVHELDPDSKLSLSNAPTPDASPRGMGGVDNRIYLSDVNVNNVYELDLDTKLQLSVASAPSSDVRGAGGIENRLYICDTTLAVVYEIDINTKLQLSSGASPGTAPRGVGGIPDLLFLVDSDTDLIYNINPDTFIQLSSENAPSSNPNGVGGTKYSDVITISTVEFNNVVYELTNDSPFRIQGTEVT